MKEPGRISLADVAKRVGVSRMTVSLALREDGRIPKETRQRVQLAAKALGYKPNATLSRILAETVRTRHGTTGGTLAFITTEPTGQDFPGDPATFAATSERAATYGYSVERFWISDPQMSSARFNHILWSRGVEGIIIPNLSHALYARGQRSLAIDWAKFCTVEISDSMLEPVINRVRHNHFGAILDAFAKLEALGYRRIGLCLTDEVDLRTHHRWAAAYMLWRAMRPREKKLKPLLAAELTAESVGAWARQLRLEVVLSPGTEVLELLRAGGLRVPADIGFASLDAWGAAAGRVSGVDQETRVLAGFAVDMLVTLIQRRSVGIPDHPLEWLFLGKWIDGETTRRQEGAEPLPHVDSQLLAF